MNKTSFFICFLCLCVRSWAQPSEPDVVHYIEDLKAYEINVPAINMANYQILDTALFHVIYRMNYRIYPEQDKKSTWVHLDVGINYAKFYIDDYYRRDSLYTFRFKNIIPSYTCKKAPCEEILFDIKLQEMDVYNRAIGETSTLSIYKEAIPGISWTIFDNTAINISGHLCFKAHGTFGGREWTVWFAPDIPVPFGPWKLSGLPGMILKAEDTRGEYSFEMIQLTHPGREIKRYNCNYHLTDKVTWRNYEKALHQSPTANVGDNIWFMYNGKRLDNTWSIPYNPIELE